MRGLVIFSAIICLMVAALFSYIANDSMIFGIFAGFDAAYLVGVAVISKLTEAPEDKEFDAYRSAHSL